MRASSKKWRLNSGELILVSTFITHYYWKSRLILRQEDRLRAINFGYFGIHFESLRMNILPLTLERPLFPQLLRRDDSQLVIEMMKTGFHRNKPNPPLFEYFLYRFAKHLQESWQNCQKKNWNILLLKLMNQTKVCDTMMQFCES